MERLYFLVQIRSKFRNKMALSVLLKIHELANAKIFQALKTFLCPRLVFCLFGQDY